MNNFKYNNQKKKENYIRKELRDTWLVTEGKTNQIDGERIADSDLSSSFKRKDGKTDIIYVIIVALVPNYEIY